MPTYELEAEETKWLRMGIQCVSVISDRGDDATVCLELPYPFSKPPKGFPRGEMMCVNSAGNQVRRYGAGKLLDWLVKFGLVRFKTT